MGSINRSDNKLFTEFAESYAISKHKRSIAIKYSEAVRARAKSVRNIPLGRQMLSKEEIEDDRRVEVSGNER